MGRVECVKRLLLSRVMFLIRVGCRRASSTIVYVLSYLYPIPLRSLVAARRCVGRAVLAGSSKIIGRPGKTSAHTVQYHSQCAPSSPQRDPPAHRPRRHAAARPRRGGRAPLLACSAGRGRPRPPRVVFVIGCVSCNKSLTSGKNLYFSIGFAPNEAKVKIVCEARVVNF
jgi:hypothetical protein